MGLAFWPRPAFFDSIVGSIGVDWASAPVGSGNKAAATSQIGCFQPSRLKIGSSRVPDGLVLNGPFGFGLREEAASSGQKKEAVSDGGLSII